MDLFSMVMCPRQFHHRGGGCSSGLFPGGRAPTWTDNTAVPEADRPEGQAAPAADHVAVGEEPQVEARDGVVEVVAERGGQDLPVEGQDRAGEGRAPGPRKGADCGEADLDSRLLFCSNTPMKEQNCIKKTKV